MLGMGTVPEIIRAIALHPPEPVEKMSRRQTHAQFALCVGYLILLMNPECEELIR